jgi:hypothetical protein
LERCEEKRGVKEEKRKRKRKKKMDDRKRSGRGEKERKGGEEGGLGIVFLFSNLTYIIFVL